jgi:hypothetical protein
MKDSNVLPLKKTSKNSRQTGFGCCLAVVQSVLLEYV